MKVVLGLGANVGDVGGALHDAVEGLAAQPGTTVLAESSRYRTTPIGPPQPDFLNAALLVETVLAPRRLLRICQDLESRAGRARETTAKWGPRTLDIDILIIDGILCRGPVLHVPHPQLSRRAFALVPASEVAPSWVHPFSGLSLEAMAEAAWDRDRAAVTLAENGL